MDKDRPLWIVCVKDERALGHVEAVSPVFADRVSALEWQMATGRRGEYAVMEI